MPRPPEITQEMLYSALIENSIVQMGIKPQPKLRQPNNLQCKKLGKLAHPVRADQMRP